MQFQSFTFNPFEENTYVLYDETGECIIIDPGCYEDFEKKKLSDFIEKHKLQPVKILMTHAHIDHMLGNNYLTARYDITIQLSFIETPLLNAAPEYGRMWGIEAEPSPEPEINVEEKHNITFGNNTLIPFFTPGHSPGSFSFLHKESGNLFSGDVLFKQSIGRTDLPGGNQHILFRSIREKLLILDDKIKVHPGHGPSTTIGEEKVSNPFITRSSLISDEPWNENQQ
jgi:hydroxyacylglutathione hydrolase